MKVVVVTGVSGAGKSTALRALEDLGFYCADNLPMPLLPKFIELLAAREEVARAALVVDARSGDFLDDAAPMLEAVRAAGHSHRGAVPRRARRRADPALLRDAAAPPAVGQQRTRGAGLASGRRWRRCGRRPPPSSTPAT